MKKFSKASFRKSDRLQLLYSEIMAHWSYD